MDASFYHVFSYSERPNTLAAGMEGKVPGNVIAQRSKMLQSLANQKQTAFYRQNLGSTRPVLFESQQKEDRIFGFTDNYIKIEMPYEKELAESIALVRLDSLKENHHVEGTIV
jgi:threonylcarbamoyladenosine tRNA methylthiotransferase MtaB